MLESIAKEYHVLIDQPTLGTFMNDIDSRLLNEILELLKPLNDRHIALSSDKNVTFNSVVLTYLDI